jgi:hypothetical protein
VKRGEGEISWREEGEGVFRGFSKNSPVINLETMLLLSTTLTINTTLTNLVISPAEKILDADKKIIFARGISENSGLRSLDFMPGIKNNSTLMPSS